MTTTPALHADQSEVHTVDGPFKRFAGNPIITAADIPYPANSVFNAAATLLPDGDTLLLMRVEDRRGLSHLTVARSHDGVGDWRIDATPTFPADPEGHPEELWGVEDPRITWVEDMDAYVIAYTAYSAGGPLVSLATTRDFESFIRLGPVTLPENKDAALFPVRFRRAIRHAEPAVTIPADGRARLALVLSRPHPLGGTPSSTPMPQRGLVGREQDRPLAAAASHRRRLAPHVSRGPAHDCRWYLPARFGPVGRERPSAGSCAELTSGSSVPKRDTSDREMWPTWSSPAAGWSRATRCGSITARPTAAWLSLPLRSRRRSTGSAGIRRRRTEPARVTPGLY